MESNNPELCNNRLLYNNRLPASMIGHAWKSCCSSNTDSSHGSMELCSLWLNTMELAAGRT